MSMPVFDNPWYAQIIARFSEDGATDQPSAILALGRMLLAGSAMIAQAIEGLAAELKKVADNSPGTC